MREGEERREGGRQSGGIQTKIEYKEKKGREVEEAGNVLSSDHKNNNKNNNNNSKVNEDRQGKKSKEEG